LEKRVLRQETVAWVNGLRARYPYDLKNSVHKQVTLVGGRGSDTVGLVSLLNEHGVTVSVGVDGHGLDAHLFASLDYSARDLTTVSDKNAIESLGVRFGPRAELSVL